MTKPSIRLQAICDSDNMFAGTSSWAFIQVLDGVGVESNSQLDDHVFVEDCTAIEDHIAANLDIQVCGGIGLCDGADVGLNVTAANDRFSPIKQHQETFAGEIDDGGHTGKQLGLDNQNLGNHIPGMTRSARSSFTIDAVFASHQYWPGDDVRSQSKFHRLAEQN